MEYENVLLYLSYQKKVKLYKRNHYAISKEVMRFHWTHKVVDGVFIYFYET